MKRKLKRLELSNGSLVFDPTDEEIKKYNDQIVNVMYEEILSKEEYDNSIASREELEKFIERWKQPVDTVNLSVMGNCGVVHTFKEWTKCKACETPKPTAYETFNK